MSQQTLPTGPITFLLTDIEGSTKLWQEHPTVMASVVERHDALIARAVEERGGVFVKSKGEGDSTFSVFSRPTDAVAASVDIQRALAAEPWPAGIEIRVRAAAHTGEAQLRDGDYYGTSVNRCARLRGVAHGGQTVCSEMTADLLGDTVPSEIILRDLGIHRLRDLERPERIFQIASADLPQDFPPLRSLDVVRHNLPIQRTTFVGRTQQVVAVQKLLADNRLVTLTGVGGCGKTRLAIKVATEELERFPDGVFFVELAPVSDPDVVPSTVAAAVGMPGTALGSGSGRSVREDVLGFLSERAALLVLDNCEHLVDVSAELCDDLLSHCPRLSILATSREALEVDGEQTYSVPSLAVPTGDDVSEAESVRLFCDRAASVRAGFALTPENETAVAEICRRLDGIPLAVELAAAQIAHLSPGQIADRLGDRFRLLTGGRRRVQRQQTLGAMLDWSYELLDEDEQVLLRRLAVFPGTFTLQAAEAVCQKDMDRSVVAVIRSLVGKSLVLAEEAEDDLRYRLLETVRLYAEDKLVAAGEADTYRARHRDFYVTWLEAIPAEVGMYGRYREVLGDQHNIRAALVWSADEASPALVGRLATQSLPLWTASGGATEGLRWLALALERREDLDPAVETACLAISSWLANVIIDPEAMVTFGEQALAVAAEGAEYWTALAHGILCLYWSFVAHLGDVDAAERTEMHGMQSVEIARTASTESLLNALNIYGMCIANLRDYDRSAEVLGRALEIAQRGNDSTFAALVASRRAVVLFLAGHNEEALVNARLANVLTETMTQWDSGWLPWIRTPLALALAANGQSREAHDHLENLLEGLMETKIPGFLGEGFVVLGAIAAMRGDWERASRLLGTAGREGPTRSPPTLALYSDTVDSVKRALDTDTRRRCRREGMEMPAAEAARYGLEALIAT